MTLTDRTKLGGMTLGDVMNYLEEKFGANADEVSTALGEVSTMLAMDDVPEEAGTYVLTCTVTAGESESDPPTVEFSWEATGE